MTMPAMFCDHANECPATCPCEADCYCRVEGTCKARAARAAASGHLQQLVRSLDAIHRTATLKGSDVLETAVNDAKAAVKAMNPEADFQHRSPPSGALVRGMMLAIRQQLPPMPDAGPDFIKSFLQVERIAEACAEVAYKQLWALAPYVKHHNDCLCLESSGYTCTCGLDRARL